MTGNGRPLVAHAMKNGFLISFHCISFHTRFDTPPARFRQFQDMPPLADRNCMRRESLSFRLHWDGPVGGDDEGIPPVVIPAGRHPNILFAVFLFIF